MDRNDALRTAMQALQARRFGAALDISSPWANDPGGRLLYALALAGSGAVEPAAPLLAQIARANPRHDHPLQDLLPLLRLKPRWPTCTPRCRVTGPGCG